MFSLENISLIFLWTSLQHQMMIGLLPLRCPLYVIAGKLQEVSSQDLHCVGPDGAWACWRSGLLYGFMLLTWSPLCSTYAALHNNKVLACGVMALPGMRVVLGSAPTLVCLDTSWTSIVIHFRHTGLWH